jgi:hypothetical protein
MMILSVVVLVAVAVLIAFGINGLLLWGACWALNAIGINTIGGWTVEFSWALVVLFTIVEIILKSIFKKTEVKND